MKMYSKMEVLVLMQSAGLSYDYFIREAKAIITELKEKPQVSEGYVREKVKNVLRLFKDLEIEKKRQEEIRNAKVQG